MRAGRETQPGTPSGRARLQRSSHEEVAATMFGGFHRKAARSAEGGNQGRSNHVAGRRGAVCRLGKAHPHLGFHESDLGFHISDLGFPDSDLGFGNSDLGFRKSVPGLGSTRDRMPVHPRSGGAISKVGWRHMGNRHLACSHRRDRGSAANPLPPLYGLLGRARYFSASRVWRVSSD